MMIIDTLRATVQHVISPCFGAGPFETVEELNAQIVGWVKRPPPGVGRLYIPAVCPVPQMASFLILHHGADRLVAIGFSGEGSRPQWDEAITLVGLDADF